MKEGINSKVMKMNNALLILGTIMRRAPVSRSELNQLLGLTQVSVINVTNALMEAGIIVAVGNSNDKNHGRKSVVLDINENAFYSVGVELSVGKVICGLGNSRGDILKAVETDYDANSSVEEFIDIIEASVCNLLQEYSVDRQSVLGVGLAVPGPLDVQGGIVVNPPNFPNWKNIPIKKLLEERLGLRVCIDMETNLAALAENFYGVSAGYKTSFFLSLFKLGVGGGLISQENIFHGFKDGAGEVGHMIVDPRGRKCSCGNYGCLEAMISEEYLLEQVKYLYKIGMETNFPDNLENITIEEVIQRSDTGDRVCETVVTQMAAYISLVLGNVITMFSPELIVLGGPLTQISNRLVQEVADRIHNRPYPRHCSEIKIAKSALGSQVYVKGAIALTFKTFLACALPEFFKGIS